MSMRWNFPVIDADAHVVEPVDMWEKYLPERYRSRGPQVVTFDAGGLKRRGWKYESSDTPVPFLVNLNGAGLSELDWKPERDTYIDGRHGGYDPAARLSDMDIDGVEAAVLFPGYMLNGPGVVSDDPELQGECVKAYNNWLSDFCSHDAGRLWGVALIPVSGIDDAVAELKRVRDLPGIRGVLLSSWPSGSFGLPDYETEDRFWAAAADLDMAVTIHVGFLSVPVGKRRDEGEFQNDVVVGATMARSASGTMPLLASILLGGVLERHPNLRISFDEVGAGWIPHFLQELDNVWMHHRHTQHHGSSAYKLRQPPSEAWCRQGWATFMTDHYAMENWENPALIDSACWSSDYPHTLGPWPNSRINIEGQMTRVPEPARQKFLNENVSRLFGITQRVSADQ